ncbi:hypothetical protein ACROYT_G023012 [Oculina patagonica]
MELILSKASILTSCQIILSYLGGEFLMELTLCEGSILTSCWIILSYLVGEFHVELILSVVICWQHIDLLLDYCVLLGAVQRVPSETDEPPNSNEEVSLPPKSPNNEQVDIFSASDSDSDSEEEVDNALETTLSMIV